MPRRCRRPGATSAGCRRGSGCAFAHSREEARTPLLSREEEAQEPGAMTEHFFLHRFKTLWCPIGVTHDWQTCVYAHNYQDARRRVSIGYGPKPCPEWTKNKKDGSADYASRCSLGIFCPYAHGAKEQLYHPLYFRTVVCRDTRSKVCPREQLCAFFHRNKERRKVAADQTNYSAPLKDLPPDWVAEFLDPPFRDAAGGGRAAGHIAGGLAVMDSSTGEDIGRMHEGAAASFGGLDEALLASVAKDLDSDPLHLSGLARYLQEVQQEQDDLDLADFNLRLSAALPPVIFPVVKPAAAGSDAPRSRAPTVESEELDGASFLRDPCSAIAGVEVNVPDAGRGDSEWLWSAEPWKIKLPTHRPRGE